MDTLCIICRYDGSPNNECSFQTQLCEDILRHYMGNITIHRESGKKPYCDGFEFNFSHTCGAVAVAISDFPIGVDIEKIRPARMGAAKRLFTANEISEENFWEIWTAKEALAKHCGKGLGSYLAEIDTLSDEYSAQLHRYVCSDFICTVFSDIAPKFVQLEY